MLYQKTQILPLPAAIFKQRNTDQTLPLFYSLFLAHWCPYNLLKIIESVAMVTTYLLRLTGPLTLTNIMIEIL